MEEICFGIDFFVLMAIVGACAVFFILGMIAGELTKTNPLERKEIKKESLHK